MAYKVYMVFCIHPVHSSGLYGVKDGSDPLFSIEIKPKKDL